MNEIIKFDIDIDKMCELYGYSYAAKMSPLHLAGQKGHKAVVESLLAAGAKSDLRGGQRGETAFELAKAAGHRAIASILKKNATL